MLKTKRVRTPVDYKVIHKSQTIPDQSMSIQEIVKRFVRGIPVDVIKREGIYLEQSDYDFEKLSRMEFGEKAEMAAEMADKAARIKAGLEANEREKRAKKAKAQHDAQASAKGSGIGNLDNTMPVDTKQ